MNLVNRLYADFSVIRQTKEKSNEALGVVFFEEGSKFGVRAVIYAAAACI
jgi:hypothetical protein